ncbi:MAG: NUDIX hydrolase [Candidatus Omnitrophica bacterium]|nr:NUDIX hydrolase [Candidatus Omnitrophota bacterium]
MNIIQAVAILNKQVGDPSRGLPKEVFRLMSRITPLVNVDLLIKDERGRTLLSWRDDGCAGKGWHLPGGILRFKEKLETRVLKVAETEIGTGIIFDKVPIAVNELILPEQDERGHFISFLFKCFLTETFLTANNGMMPTDPGYLMWHDFCPENLVTVQAIYRKYI